MLTTDSITDGALRMLVLLLHFYSLGYGHFRPRRHRMEADRYRTARATAFKVWKQETCAKLVA